MNTTLKATLVLFVVCALCFGQAAMTKTTLSAAINSTQNTIIVASATGFAGQGFPESQGGIGSSTTAAQIVAVVDQEAMRVTAVSGTTITVRRGDQGTRSYSHASGARVWVGPASYFGSVDPSGSCTATALTVLPRIVIPTGKVWNCGNSIWTTIDGSMQTVGATLALSTGGTSITPTNPIHHVSGTSTVFATIVVPAALPYTGGCITLIPDGAWHTATSDNIAVVSTAVANVAMRMCYSPVDSKWYPSY